MSQSFAEQLVGVFAAQSCARFVLREEILSEEFGNAAVTFSSPDLLIRVVRERGQIFVEFASEAKPDEWFDWLFVSMLVGDPEESDLSLMALPGFLDRRCQQLRHAFSPAQIETTTDLLTSMMRKRAEKTFGL